MSNPSEGLVLDHYRWPQDRNRKMLAGFDTGRAVLKPRHREWLRTYVAGRVRAGQWVFLRGYASRRGDANENQQLSERRVQAVRDFLMSQGGVRGNRITGVEGVGEAWSGGTQRDDSPEWRAVEVIVSNGVVRLPGIRIGGGSPLSQQFWVKYLGGGGGGPGFALGVHGFMIRNPGNWYVEYGLGTAGGSIGAPASYGNALPPGQGWVRFTTATPRTVDSFDGRAYLRQSGVQIGDVGHSFVFKLYVPDAFEANLQSGSGFSLTLYDVGGGPFDSDDRGPHRGQGWQRA